MAREVGIEPTTIRLTVERSAAELLPNTGGIISIKWGYHRGYLQGEQ
jgi:hypothetical protein